MNLNSLRPDEKMTYKGGFQCALKQWSPTTGQWTSTGPWAIWYRGAIQKEYITFIFCHLTFFYEKLLKELYEKLLKKIDQILS